MTAAALVVGGVSVATWAATSRPPTPEPVPATATSTPPEPSLTPAPSVTPRPRRRPSAAATPARLRPTTGFPGRRAAPSTWGRRRSISVAGATDPLLRPARGGRRGRRHRLRTPAGPTTGGGSTTRDGDVLADLGRRCRVVASRDGRMLSRSRRRGGPVTVRRRAWPRRRFEEPRRETWSPWPTVGCGPRRQDGATGWAVATGETRTLACAAQRRVGRRATRCGGDPTGSRWRDAGLLAGGRPHERSAPVLLERCGDDNPDWFQSQRVQ